MNQNSTIPRRTFLQQTTAAGIALTTAATVQAETKSAPAKIDRKIKVGLVGCGGRGSWIAGLFKEHGGYEFVAAADYFPDRAEKTGTSLGADKAKCFSGLSAYKRLIESGVEAVILETPPYFFPEHAAAAVEAGLHVYMAKPVAVDVPGTLKIGGLGKTAAGKKRVFLVDYQMPTDPFNIEVRKRLHEGGLGDAADGLLRRQQRRRRFHRSAAGQVDRKPPDRPDLGQRRRHGLRLHRQLRHPRHRRRDLGPRSPAGFGLWPRRPLPQGSARRFLGQLFRHLRLRRRPDLEPSQC